MDSPTVYWIKVIIGIGVIGGAVLYFVLYLIEQNDKEIEQKKSSTTGTIASKIIPGRNYVNVSFGRSNVRVTIESLRSGMSLEPFSAFGGRDISIKLKDERILVSATFRNLDGNLVAKIIDNEWKTHSRVFDRNYDDNGLEIIDDEVTKFQIDYTDIYNIRIGGCFVLGNSFYAFLPDGGTIIIGITGTNRGELIKLSSSVKEMFLYPSDKHFGIRAPFSIKGKLLYYVNGFILTDLKTEAPVTLTDTSKVYGVRFGGMVSNSGDIPLKVRTKLIEVYFEGQLFKTIPIDKEHEAVILPNNNDSFVVEDVFFRESREAISYDELRKKKIEFHIIFEYSDLAGTQKDVIDIRYPLKHINQ